MNQDVLPVFFHSWLTSQGAVFETFEEATEALLEPQTANILHCPETVRFVYSAQAPGTYIGLGTEILESILSNVSSEIPVAFARLEGFSLRGKNLDQDLTRDFTFFHCIPGRMDTCVTHIPLTRVMYRLAMQSDEVREVLIQIDCQEKTQRLFSAGDKLLEDVDLVFLEVGDPDLQQFTPLPTLLENLSGLTKQLAEDETTTFQKTLTHRMNLDMNRIAVYFSGLLDGLESRYSKKHISLQDYNGKKDAITADFHHQIEDLRRKYGLQVRLLPVAVLRMLLPVVKANVTMKLGKTQKSCEFFWSPISRAFEPFFCPVCRSHGTKIEGNRDGLLLCPACAVGKK
ncbi:MAG: hypothetical protein HQM09_06185 [Candidatus Riflebacteria bacterium]|nr:hypothetical protein [Candidatus Riflebacteria bacterium]